MCSQPAGLERSFTTSRLQPSWFQSGPQSRTLISSRSNWAELKVAVDPVCSTRLGHTGQTGEKRDCRTGQCGGGGRPVRAHTHTVCLRDFLGFSRSFLPPSVCHNTRRTLGSRQRSPGNVAQPPNIFPSPATSTFCFGCYFIRRQRAGLCSSSPSPPSSSHLPPPPPPCLQREY